MTSKGAQERPDCKASCAARQLGHVLSGSCSILSGGRRDRWPWLDIARRCAWESRTMAKPLS